jgi:Zn-dependent protease
MLFMAIISFQEIFDIIIMCLAVGFIFKDTFRRPVPSQDQYDPLAAYDKKLKKKFDWEDLWYAIIVAAPAIILHEFGHKFVAMAFGLSATFHAAYLWLGVGIVLKILSFPFIFFVPAFVTYPSAATDLQTALISVAGPLVNCILWITAIIILRSKKLSRKLTIPQRHGLYLMKMINLFLFGFNMIPIPGFDGWHFFISLWNVFVG